MTGFFQFFRRFPQINVGGDSAHLSSFGKRTREPRLAHPQKGMLRQYIIDRYHIFQLLCGIKRRKKEKLFSF